MTILSEFEEIKLFVPDRVDNPNVSFNSRKSFKRLLRDTAQVRAKRGGKTRSLNHDSGRADIFLRKFT